MPNPQLCQRIVCGAVSQAEAGLDALWECSQAGYAGALPCSHPVCRPYMDELRARGMCPAPEEYMERVVEALPLHPPVQPDEGEPPLPPVDRITPAGLVAPMPSMQVAQAPITGAYCQFMSWVEANQCLAAAGAIAVWLVLRGRD